MFIISLFSFETYSYADDKIKQDGYFWEKLTNSEKQIYVIAFVTACNQMNETIRMYLELDIGMYTLEKNERNKHISEHAKEMNKIYVNDLHYFEIPLIQLLEGIETLYNDLSKQTD